MSPELTSSAFRACKNIFEVENAVFEVTKNFFEVSNAEFEVSKNFFEVEYAEFEIANAPFELAKNFFEVEYAVFQVLKGTDSQMALKWIHINKVGRVDEPGNRSILHNWRMGGAGIKILRVSSRQSEKRIFLCEAKQYKRPFVQRRRRIFGNYSGWSQANYSFMQITKLDAYWQVNDFPAQFSNEIYVSEKTAFYFSYRSVFSLKYVAKGEEIYRIGGRDMCIPVGGYLLVNDGQDVTTIPHIGNEQAMSVFLEPGLLADVHRNWTETAGELADDPFSTGSTPCFFEAVYRQPDDSLGLFLGNLRQRMAQQKGLTGQYDLHLFYEIAEQVLRSQLGVFQQIGKIGSLRKSTKEELYRRVSVGRDYLANHVNRTVPLHEVACQACLSPYHFHRVFQQAFGCTPLHFQKAKKMEKACHLLRSGHCSVTEVSFELGYPDLFTFSKDFKKWMGCPPGKLSK